MALVVYDRVQQTGTANTTVSFTLSGSVTGYQSFSVVGNGNTTFYAATDTTGNWEVGVGTYATGGTLTRTTILSSSNSGSAVTFSGTCNVFVTYPSGKSVNLNASGNVTALGTISSGVWNGTTIPVAYGGTGVTTSTGVSSVVLRDANSNVTANNFLAGYNVITAAAGTTVLTVSSAFYQRISGSTTQTIQLPIATTLVQGQGFTFDNDSSGAVSIVDSASGAIDTVPSGGYSYIFAEDVTTSAGSWGKYALLPASYDFSTTSANFGTAVISNTTYQGTAVAPGYGGTGLTTFAAANNAIYSTSASALAAGTLPVAAGGTGQTTASAAFNALSPITTTGDLILGNGTNSATRLGIGASTYVLTSNGTTASWAAPSGSSSAFYTRTSFTATAGQTTFTVSYTAGQIQVYVNGVMLNGADYTATNGTSVVLAVGRATNDIVEMVAFTTGSVTPTNLSVGTSLVQGGTSGYVLYNNAGVVGNLATTGSGSVVLGTSPTITTATLSSPTINTPTMGGSVITSGTAVASTSGTSITFTGIPSWAKRITVMFSGISTNGSSDFLVKLGTSGGVVSTGYLGSSSVVSSGVASTAFTTGFGIAQYSQGSGYVGNGMMTICLLNSSTNIWVQSGTMGESDAARSAFFGGSVTLSGVVTTVTITTVNGTDTFDAGSINILYE